MSRAPTPKSAVLSATPASVPVDEAAAYQGAIDRLAPGIAVADRERRRAANLDSDPLFRAIDTSKHDASTVIPAWTASCVVVGVNPNHPCANQDWLQRNLRSLNGESARLVDQLFRLYKLATHDTRRSGVSVKGEVRLTEFASWARAEGWTALTSSTAFTHAASIPPASRYKMGFEQQEAAVLEALRKLGYEPLSLPQRVNGKPWVKAAVRDFLGHHGMWAPKTAFTHTWDRLRAHGKIAEAA